MSANDVELKDLLIQALELNGGLAKIRAQLRACIFKVLNDDEKTSKQPQFVNNKLKQYLEDPDGRLMFTIVRNFLEYFDLDCTLSVFEQECCWNRSNNDDNPQEILKKISINQQNGNSNGPILMELIKVLKHEHNNNNINDKTINESINNRTYEIDSPVVLNKENQPNISNVIKENVVEENHQIDSNQDNNNSYGGSNVTYEEDFTGDTINNSVETGRSEKQSSPVVDDTSNHSIITTETGDKSD